MNSSPYGGKREKEMGVSKAGAPMKSANFEKSGMKTAEGKDVKPGAPGFFGKMMDPLGLFKKAKGLMGGKKGGCPPAAAAAAPEAAAPTPGVEGAGPATPPPAPVEPPVPPVA